eukprot:518510_1
MVKYLVIPALESLNASLQRINFGDHSICGRLNCYSLKMVQKDKKLVKHLQRSYSNESVAQNHFNKNRNINPKQLNKLVQIPIGNLAEFSTIRLISYFISTLNTTYTDFDFTNCEPNQFLFEKPSIINETINARLSPLTKTNPLLINSFWKTINSIMDLTNCKFYSFTPNDDIMQCLRPHSLWNIDYFIVNIKQKQLLYLSFYSQNNLLKDELKCDMDIDNDNIIAFDCDVNDQMAWLPKNQSSPKKHKNIKKNVTKNGDNNSKNKSNGTELRVMSINNCLDTMPQLEKP